MRAPVVLFVALLCSTFVLLTAGVPLPQPVDLTQLRGANGMAFTGFGSLGFSSVTSVGDLNGDTFPDFALGASTAAAGAGQVFIVFGDGQPLQRPASMRLEPAAFDGTTGVVLQGPFPGASLGWSLSGGFDVNGDGMDDVVIGSPGPTPPATGRVFVLFGRAGPWPAFITLTTNGGPAVEDRWAVLSTPLLPVSFGYSVSGVGDVNGDGFGDFMVGTLHAETAPVSAAFALVFGRATWVNVNIGLFNAVTGVTLVTNAVATGTAFVVSGAGDVNGDGLDDALVAWNQGTVTTVVFGRATWPAGVTALPLLGGTTSIGSAPLFVTRVAAAGDVNADGMHDFMLGAPGAALVYLIYGRPTWPTSMTLSSDFDDTAVVVRGPLASSLGHSLAGVGDVDGDGVDDVLMGAPAGTGVCYLLYGDADLPADVSVASLDGINGVSVRGTPTAALLGASVGSAGDFNGDGKGDLLLAANSNGVFGEAYVVYSDPPAPPTPSPVTTPPSGVTAAPTPEPGVLNPFTQLLESVGDAVDRVITAAQVTVCPDDQAEQFGTDLVCLFAEQAGAIGNLGVGTVVALGDVVITSANGIVTTTTAAIQALTGVDVTVVNLNVEQNLIVVGNLTLAKNTTTAFKATATTPTNAITNADVIISAPGVTVVDGCANVDGTATVTLTSDPGPLDNTGPITLVTADCVVGRFDDVHGFVSIEGVDSDVDCLSLGEADQVVDTQTGTISVSFPIERGCGKGLSTGAIVGIVFGCIIPASVAVVVLVALEKRRRYQKAQQYAKHGNQLHVPLMKAVHD